MSYPEAIYVCIGNSDDKLSQQDWHLFFSHVRELIERHSTEVYGVWHSLPAELWQNACFGFTVDRADKKEFIRMRLGELADLYHQEWISWTEGRTARIDGSAAGIALGPPSARLAPGLDQ